MRVYQKNCTNVIVSIRKSNLREGFSGFSVFSTVVEECMHWGIFG